MADIRIGILTIREKWAMLTAGEVLTEAFPDAFRVEAAAIPSLDNFFSILAAAENGIEILSTDEIRVLEYPWQLFLWNDQAMREDFRLITANRKSAPLSSTNTVINAAQVFIEAGATVEHSFLNASTGPIYIAKNATVMEGNMVRGPFALGENSVLKMGSKVYGATSIGPGCVAGGEIKNSILFANSNKAHDGYLGDSVLGEWCNLGAGTSNSNVKNTGAAVKYIINEEQEMHYAGNKAGLLMGDYSRAAINTSFNTGTIVGVCCNIFGDAPSKFIPDFSWGRERYIFEKAIQDISNWKQMKQQALSAEETTTLQQLYLSK
ncbi:MAG: glucose-phosphate thymidylyltransferase [Ferruginibacter sp.]|nr:glucose-phosphate thymidylyltransferase [Ferruginibacter sp.]